LIGSVDRDTTNVTILGNDNFIPHVMQNREPVKSFGKRLYRQIAIDQLRS
jgi:mannitol/fructose-specific phosphotransferase system IIA component